MEKLKSIFMTAIVLVCIVPAFALITCVIPLFWIFDLFKFLCRSYFKKTS